MATREAPWRAIFASHLDAVRDAGAEVQIAFATVTTPTNLPRVRYVGHAGFWSVKTAVGGRRTFSSPCPTFVTDSRLNKVAQIFGRVDRSPSDPRTHGFGSGGGGAVEATYWLERVRMQWRLRGRCFFVVDGNDVAAESLGGETGGLAIQESKRVEGLAVTKAAVRPHMSVVDEGQEASGSGGDNDPLDDDSIWEAEVEGYYMRLSTSVRQSFSRSTFTVGIVVPEEVEMMDLTDASVARRRIWRCVTIEQDGTIAWEVIWDDI